MEFYQKLQKLRKEQGMSQEELANQLNVSRQAVSKWESGQGYPETEKLLQIGALFSVSMDYLLKSEPLPQVDGAPVEEGYYASREIVESYLAGKQRSALRISVGVALCIISSVFRLLLGNGLGMLFFFLCAALGVGLLVFNGFAPKTYTELETQPLVFDPAFIRNFRTRYTMHRKKYGLLIAGSIVLIILSVGAFVFLEEFFQMSGDQYVAIIPACTSLSVAIMILASSANAAEETIAMNAEHIEELKEENTYCWVSGIIMGLAAMIFLAVGIIWKVWRPTWLVFPVAALLSAGIVNILKFKDRK